MKPNLNDAKAVGLVLKFRKPTTDAAALPTSAVSVSRVVPFERIKPFLSSKPLRGRRIISPAAPLALDRLEWEGRTFLFAKPLACEIRCEEGLWIVECTEVDARAYDESRKAAIRALGEEFAMLWDEYALAPEEQLAPDALELKRRLLQIAREEVSK